MVLCWCQMSVGVNLCLCANPIVNYIDPYMATGNEVEVRIFPRTIIECFFAFLKYDSLPTVIQALYISCG